MCWSSTTATLLIRSSSYLHSKVYKVVIEKDINSNDKTAGIIDKSNDINLVFFPIRSFEIGSDAGIATPDLS